jgi:DnaK suppressor protein
MAKPLTDQDRTELKEILLNLKSRLQGDVGYLVDAALGKEQDNDAGDLSHVPIHMADQGSDNFERDFSLTRMESETETLEKVEESLERIEDGSYGRCTSCRANIPKDRLNVLPFADLCVKCASRQESKIS